MMKIATVNGKPAQLQKCKVEEPDVGGLSSLLKRLCRARRSCGEITRIQKREFKEMLVLPYCDCMKEENEQESLNEKEKACKEAVLAFYDTAKSYANSGVSYSTASIAIISIVAMLLSLLSTIIAFIVFSYQKIENIKQSAVIASKGLNQRDISSLLNNHNNTVLVLIVLFIVVSFICIVDFGYVLRENKRRIAGIEIIRDLKLDSHYRQIIKEYEQLL